MVGEQKEAEQRNFWIFQAKPEIYDLNLQLDPEKTVEWRIRRHFREIKPGDIVLFWQAGDKRGIYGWGEITAEPYQDSKEPKKSFSKGFKPLYRAPAVFKVQLSEPILAEQLQRHPVLQNLLILRSPEGASFRVSPEEATALHAMLEPEERWTMDTGPPPIKKKDPMEELVGATAPTLVTDHWADQDALGFTVYSEAIATFIENEETHPPLTISIQAPWGGGKTSLMRQIQKRLDPIGYEKSIEVKSVDVKSVSSISLGDCLAELEAFKSQNGPKRLGLPRDRFVSVWFNAWRYQSSDQIWAGLADAIIRQVSRRFVSPKDRERFFFRLNLSRLDELAFRRQIWTRAFDAFWSRSHRWLTIVLLAIVGWVLAYVGGAFGKMHGWLPGVIPPILGAMGAAFKAASDWLEEREKIKKEPAGLSIAACLDVPDYRRHLGLVHQAEEDIGRVFSLTPGCTPVIFIDDLDRCSPTNVAAVFEGLNLFLAGDSRDCILFIGMDPELVSAALEESHKDVIQHLSKDNKRLAVGWRYMDKFVQLPFVIPPLSEDALDAYMQSLLPIGQAAEEEGPVPTEQPGPPREAVGERVRDKVAKGLETIAEDVDVQKQIRSAREDFSRNPREFKRFLNVFRFYYALYLARLDLNEAVPSLSQIRRWIKLTLEWPEVERWLRRSYTRWEEDTAPPDVKEKPERTAAGSRLEHLEQLATDSTALEDWVRNAENILRVTPEEAPWIEDYNLFRFFKREVDYSKEEQQLSKAAGRGFW